VLVQALEQVMSARQMRFLALVDSTGAVRGEVGNRAVLAEIDPYGEYLGSPDAISQTVSWVWEHELTPQASTNGALTLVIFKLFPDRAAIGVMDGKPNYAFRYPEMVEVENELRTIAATWAGS